MGSPVSCGVMSWICELFSEFVKTFLLFELGKSILRCSLFHEIAVVDVAC